MSRLILEPVPLSGAWNMAVDEALLDGAVAGGGWTWRWYRWQSPTLSLGYFQRSGETRSDPRWAGVPVVRRLSGGGAILHDQELTYSLTLPAAHPRAAHPHELYVDVHRAVISLLARFGIHAQLRRDAPAAGVSGAFLCFQRGDDFDVVLHGHKILGSAQRRREGAILQHGSLVLRRSPLAPEFPGCWDLGPDPTNQVADADLLAALTDAASEILGEPGAAGILSAEESARADAYFRDKYGSPSWTERL